MRRLVTLALLGALAVPLTASGAVLPQDDASSGGDAPNAPTPSFGIDPGVVYTGAIEGNTTGDPEDWYAFDAEAGDLLTARTASTIGCIGLYDPAGLELGVGCGAAYSADVSRATTYAAVSGRHYARFFHANAAGDTVAQTYRFSVGAGETAPAPLPVPEVLTFAGPRQPVTVEPASESGEHVVIAVVDTGINPYHDYFAAPALANHPSGWLPGFPADATAVGLSLEAETYAAANAADAETWDGLARSTYDEVNDTYDTHLYTFPGTRVVGAVSFGEYTDATEAAVPAEDARPVRDDHGHGTHSAGLAAGANLTASDANVLIVVVEVGQGEFETGIRWAARQPWIDAISVSLGKAGNAPATFSPIGDRTGGEWATREAHLSDKPVFVASGNGFSNTGVAPDKCTTYTSPLTGPAWVTRIGAAKSQTGNPTWWHCVPVDAIARTDVESPSFDSLSAVSQAGGTSASTPNAAGHFAHLLLAGRRAGSALSRIGTLDHLLHAAAPPPPTVGANDPSAYPLSLADQGYGLIDGAALDAATARLLAGSGPKPRPETEAWFVNDSAIRHGLWGPGSATEGGGIPQDDAGSGTDAPDGRSERVRVEPGVRYDALLTGAVDDQWDWYAFDGVAGDQLSFTAVGAVLCYDIVSPANAIVASTCDAGYGALGGPLTWTLDETGTWYLSVYYSSPQPYSFGFGLNTPPPVLLPQ